MYIDVQYVEWKRITIPDADKEGVLQILKQAKRFTTAESLFPDAMPSHIDDVFPNELCINNAALGATVEVYDEEGKVIWDNVKLFPRPAKVITKHEMIDLSDVEEVHGDEVKSIEISNDDLEPHLEGTENNEGI